MDGQENAASTDETIIFSNDFKDRNESSEDEVDKEDPTVPSTKKKEDEDCILVPKDSVRIHKSKERNIERIKKEFKSRTDSLNEEIKHKDDIIKEMEKELAKVRCLEQEKLQLVKKEEHLDSHAAEYEEMRKENERQKQLISQYKTENEKLKNFENEIQRLQSLEADNRQYEKSVFELKQRLEMAKQTETELQVVLNRISNESKSLHEQNETVSQHNKQLEEDKKGLLLRLSELAGAKLTVSNPNIADLSDSKRPTKLAEEFAQLYDDEWTDAFEEVEIENEQEKTAFMLKILQCANEVCVNVSCNHMARIKESLCKLIVSTTESDRLSTSSPAESKSQTSRECDKEPDTIEVDFQSLPPDQIKTVIELKRSMESRLLNQFQMKATDWITRVNSIDREKQINITKYIKKCVDICWAMCQHAPPVTISFDDVHNGSLCFNSNMYRPYTKSGKFVDFIVWPALYLHDGGPLLSKGVAQGRH